MLIFPAEFRQDACLQWRKLPLVKLEFSVMSLVTSLDVYPSPLGEIPPPHWLQKETPFCTSLFLGVKKSDLGWFVVLRPDRRLDLAPNFLTLQCFSRNLSR